MKNTLLILAASSLLTVSCKNETKKTETTPNVVETSQETYQVSAKGSEVSWTGYKFTEKKGVKGKFKTINVTKAPKAKTQIEAFNGVEFNIPVSSVFSNNAIRDGKLKELFFGMMDDTEFLSGSFTTSGEEIILNLKMNGTTKEIPLTYKISDRHIKLNGKLNMLDFGAVKAYESIHKACELLHTGADGVSKTWEEVGIEAIVFLSK